MNDGAADPQGRFWAGAVTEDRRPGAGVLYRLERDGTAAAVLGGLTIPNGIGWSPDGATLYLVDSAPGTLSAHSFDGASGALGEPRVIVTIDAAHGAPDGLAVDAGGDVWLAIYGGGEVRRYTPGGELIETVALPAKQVTSCGFGGRDLDRLYITTATEGWSQERRSETPQAGLAYHLSPGSRGLPVAEFRPERAWWDALVG
jgi:sugar lactone lactonase YvrE